MLLLVLLLAGSSCDTSTHPRCLLSNCSGCCDVNDQCQLGVQNFACGQGAAKCASCAMTASCVVGLCLNPDGGLAVLDAGQTSDAGQGTTDGGVCGPSNCQGCCDSGRCRGGVLSQTCGKGGAACVACTSPLACIDSKCQTYTCPGCVAADTSCQLGNASTACGIDGGACVTCPGTQTCFGGKCVTSTTCGPANCSGCCDGLTCVSPPTTAKCGSGGDVCQTCSGTQTCATGSCGSAATGGSSGAGGGSGAGGSGGLCVPGVCDGCCQNGQCLPGNTNGACGGLGLDCKMCKNFCISGFCI